MLYQFLFDQAIPELHLINKFKHISKGLVPLTNKDKVHMIKVLKPVFLWNRDCIIVPS